MKIATVMGAGGFIGHHMARFLKNKGYGVMGVDIKFPEFSPMSDFDRFITADLREYQNCLELTGGADEVYQFAANMGGIGFITEVSADVMRDNVLINSNVAKACLENKCKVFYSSSACVYPTSLQENPEVTALKESDAYPGMPDNEYGWEKLFSERLYKAFEKDHHLQVRIARFHNIYGPEGTYDGGREKAPAAICRKVVMAKKQDVIPVWGDGKQTRSYCYISDCLEGVYRLMQSNYSEPVNIGSSELVSVDELVRIISGIAGKNISIEHQLDKPQGVRGRNSDNTLCRNVLDWAPQVSLKEGLGKTYEWLNKYMQEYSKSVEFFGGQA